MGDRAVLRARGDLVEALRGAAGASQQGWAKAPSLLRRVLEQHAWREFALPSGDRVAHRDFLAFAAATPPAGLGVSVEEMRRLTGGDPATLDLLEQALQDSTSVDNINDGPIRPTGTSQAAALRRLRKDAPELHERVIAGELSAHAAMVEAGFRSRTVTVPLARPEAAAEVLRRNLSPPELARLIELLTAPS